MVFRFFFLLTCLHAPMTNNDESLPFMNMNAVWAVVWGPSSGRGRAIKS